MLAFFQPFMNSQALLGSQETFWCLFWVSGCVAELGLGRAFSEFWQSFLACRALLQFWHSFSRHLCCLLLLSLEFVEGFSSMATHRELFAICCEIFGVCHKFCWQNNSRQKSKFSRHFPHMIILADVAVCEARGNRSFLGVPRNFLIILMLY